MGVKKDKQKQLAEAFFIENINATQLEVAQLFGVTQKTLGVWAQAGNWEEKRIDFHSSPLKIKQLIQRELLSVSQGNPAKLPADAISKLLSAYDKLSAKADPTVVQKILIDLDNFISEINPKFAIQCQEYHKKFLQHRINLEAQ